MRAYVLLTLLIVLLVNREKILNRVRLFNRRFLNPLVLRYAGRQGAFYAVMEHIGRRSGQSYRTPLVAHPIEDGFVIPLPYGTKVDWLRNIQAAGGAVLHWNGQDYRLSEPTEIDAVEARKLLPPAREWVYRVVGITHYLRVQSASQKPVEAALEAPRTEPASV
jgi:deazaflavin-dependent oxidoreductase (nitroreductase family)